MTHAFKRYKRLGVVGAGVVLAFIAACSNRPQSAVGDETVGESTIKITNPDASSNIHEAIVAAGETSPKAHEATIATRDDIENGRAVFDGKGNCTVCHTIGSQEDKGRGPDLAGIGGRAAERASQFGITGPDAAVRYLIRSIIHPADDVVEGYNPAPESWLPSGLTDDDIRYLVMYLQSLGGSGEPATVSLPQAWLAAKRQEYQRELKLFAFGDPEKGKRLFHDVKGPAACIKCHTIDGTGKTTCPDLTTEGRVQRPGYILESILDSSAFIVRGYRQLLILDADGRVFTGLPVKEDEESITLVIDQEGNTKVILKEDIDEQRRSEASMMPGGLGAQLTGEQVMDLVAYLLQHDKLAKTVVAGEESAPSGKTAQPETIAAPSLAVFDQLTEDQRRYQRAMEQGDPVIGARIYAHYCVMCHGTDGTGTGFNAVNLATKPANHTDNRRMSKTDDLLLHGVITRGGMNTGRSFLMPPWGGTFTKREIWDLVAYLRTLHTDLRP